MPARSAARTGSRAPLPGAGAGRPTPPAPLPAGHPALAAVAVLTAAFLALLVTWRLTTPDVWQHLLVGRVMWSEGRIPMTHEWTWPSFGKPEVLNSWGFRWLLWPFWSAGEAWGLQLWRWLTTLGAFGLAWATARRLGARGFAPLVVIALAALAYRTRAQVRPETLVALLLAAQIFVLERRRERGGGALALIAIAWAWPNLHLSYFVGLVLLAIHVLLVRGGGARNQTHGPLARLDRLNGPALLAAAVAVSFLNPFGWRALWQPFEYFLIWRHEPVYRTISELTPLWVNWRSTLSSGLPILIALWPLMIVVRALRGRFDRVAAVTCVFFTALAVFNTRFAGFYVVALVPYLSRDLSEVFAGLVRRIGLASAWPRAAAVAVVLALAGFFSWSDLRFPFGVGFVPTYYPTAACDFIAAHGVKGRVFNPFYLGGYLAWRFWPEQGRLPFMDIHQSGTKRDRELYTYAFANPEAWNELMRERDFEVALLDGHQEWVRGDRLVDVLDADPAWALVFRDDVAALYVRRSGPLAAVADSFAYRVMPGGQEGFVRLGAPIARDSLLRRSLRLELERRAAGSAMNAQAHSHLANLDFLEGNRAGARAHLEAALRVEPTFPGANRRLGYLEMAEQRWAEAIRAFERERRIGDPPEDEYARMGFAWERLGDRGRAAAAYRKHLEFHSGDERAREALARVGGAK